MGCLDAINELIADDRVVATILYDKKNVIPEDESLGNITLRFGGWDNEAIGDVAYAMEEAGIEGAMRVNSSFRNSYIGLKDGPIFWHNNGTNVDMLEVYRP